VSANAAREVAENLRRLRALAETDAPLAAVKALSQAGETAVKVKLTSSSHPEGSRTPSAPGEPPSLISGKLRRSLKRTPAMVTAPGCATCVLGSSLIYAPVHEFGPVTITAKRFPQLGNPTVGFFGRSVTIPKRPYMAPSMIELIASGMATRVSAEAWAAALGL
jgi:phage gpG-like protein